MPALVKKKNVLDWVISARRLIRPHSAVNVNELSGISMNKVLVPSGRLLPLTFPMAFHFFLMPTSHSHPLLCVVGCVVLKKKEKKRGINQIIKAGQHCSQCVVVFLLSCSQAGWALSLPLQHKALFALLLSPNCSDCLRWGCQSIHQTLFPLPGGAASLAPSSLAR